jgi:hypothetical protein
MANREAGTDRLEESKVELNRCCTQENSKMKRKKWGSGRLAASLLRGLCGGLFREFMGEQAVSSWRLCRFCLS